MKLKKLISILFLALAALALILGLYSCVIKQEKPFTIIAKSSPDENICHYGYQCRNGSEGNFYDFCDKYNIGDEIK